MSEREGFPTIEEAKAQVTEARVRAAADLGEDFDFRVGVLGMKLVELIYETEGIPPFEIVLITSTTNETVQPKLNAIMQISQISEHAIPPYQKTKYPIAFQDQVIEDAPWVAMVHAWMKVLSQMNTLSAIQRNEIPFSAEAIQSAAEEFFLFTTIADKKPTIRSNYAFLNNQPFVETINREAQTPGANAKRHVCYEEMLYIIDVLKFGFKKK